MCACVMCMCMFPVNWARLFYLRAKKCTDSPSDPKLEAD